MREVIIHGDGVAACCCAHLLKGTGFRLVLDRPDRRRLPAILLGEPALALIRDVFGQEDLFRDLPRIEKRVVAWGRDSTPVALDHSAVVVSEEFLLKSLWAGSEDCDSQLVDPESAWTVYASRTLPSDVVEHRFGTRHAFAVPVEIKDEPSPPTCSIESLEQGWLFLLPHARGSGWLLSVGCPVEALLGSSRTIAGRIARLLPGGGEFPAYPRIASPLCGPRWLACGTAAMAFDPICGDGTAHAVREAILTAAVIRAAANGSDTQELFSHYEARLTAGFARHLVNCLEFYRLGAAGPWWESEIESVQDGLEWCVRQRRGHTEYRYRLNGFDLQPVG